MPVTAKLSKLFYDRLGEEIATELVNWFNDVDATYRADWRELNELNFARFDAKLEQRAAALDAKIDRRAAELDAKIELRTGELRADIGRLEARVEQRLAEFRTEVQGEIHGLGARFDRLETTLERRLAEQTRWLFGAWAALLIPIIGLWLRP